MPHTAAPTVNALMNTSPLASTVTVNPVKRHERL